MSANMRIWEQVETTETRFTKPAKVGGQEITSLNGTAMIMKATEIFGPVGIGFGWTVMEERFDKSGEIFSGEGDKRFSLGHELNHTIKIKFWFVLDGRRGELEQYGCTKYFYKSTFGTTTDGEAPKKSLTDAIKKSLSMLGFSADVFLGMFDDIEYVNQLKDEERIEKADDKEVEIERQKKERLEYIKSVVDNMAGAQSRQELKKIHDVAVRKLTARKDDKGVLRIAQELKDLIEKMEGEAA
ncbi:hypothetical protein D3C84_531540 [compost metagenome]